MVTLGRERQTKKGGGVDRGDQMCRPMGSSCSDTHPTSTLHVRKIQWSHPKDLGNHHFSAARIISGTTKDGSFITIRRIWYGITVVSHSVSHR